jgi:hypothetical protein
VTSMQQPPTSLIVLITFWFGNSRRERDTLKERIDYNRQISYTTQAARPLQKTSTHEIDTNRHRLGDEHAGAANLLDLLLRQLGDEARLDNHRLLGELPLTQQLLH